MRRVARSLGQALVETALVMPLLVSLSLGVIQLVLYAHAQSVLLSAVQEGARLAAEEGRSLDEGAGRVSTLVAAGLGASVEPMRLTVSADSAVVTLEAETRLRLILPLPFVQDLPLHAVGHVARERFRPGGTDR